MSAAGPMGPFESGTWSIAVDTGGTFTDAIGCDPGGRTHQVKVLSSSALRGVLRAVSEDPATGTVSATVEGPWDVPQGFFEGFRAWDVPVAASRVDGRGVHVLMFGSRLPDDAAAGSTLELGCPEPAPLLAARLLTGTRPGEPLPEGTSLRLATTRGTNALLTRSGEPPVLVVNRGFADLPFIGTQARPDLFSLRERREPPLHGPVLEIGGRRAADGTLLEEVDFGELLRLLKPMHPAHGRVAAVALLHSYEAPLDEKIVRDCLRGAGFSHVTLSSDVARQIRLVPRMQTAIVNAYLSPVIQDYVCEVGGAIAPGSLLVMTSAGSLVGGRAFQPKDSLLSGPAGGIAGAAQAGRESGIERLLAFDMGGTSTDVARYDGQFEYTFEHRVGSARLMAPALAIESVAAGGGSICSFDGVRLRVGPESASAVPGPACYGAGGPLTVTDVNLLLGRVDASRFEIPIDRGAAERALDALRDELERAHGQRPEREGLLRGLLDLANEKMADAIRRISVRAGYDPSEYALVAFGGAGPQHACAVADRLGITTVLVPAQASLLSARGLQAALRERIDEHQVLAHLDELPGPLHEGLEKLARRAATRLEEEEGIDARHAVVRRWILSLRFAGQDAALDVDLPDPRADARALFVERYGEVFGHVPVERDIELVSMRVVVSEPEDARAAGAGAAEAGDGGRGADLHEGDRFRGPCLVGERFTTTVVDPGWEFTVDAAGALVGRRAARVEDVGAAPRSEVAEEELFAQAVTRIAEEMGAALERTAVSTNVKERLDFSCAVLDAEGVLLVNAPHIPVHLGSLGMCTREVARRVAMQPGDTVITNHPACGGSHLPDVTLVSPVHVDEELVGYVVSRAHHAEIGGTLPGSMPPSAQCLAEEGVVIAPTLYVRDGRLRENDVRALLEGGPYPSRAVHDNLADLRAALAANQWGVRALRQLAAREGTERFRRRAGALVERAARSLRATLATLGPVQRRAEELLDDGTRIAVSVDGDGRSLRVDFTGTSPVHPRNLNATPAIVHSAVLYVLRVLAEEELPLNEGLMRNVEVVLPECLLNPAFADDARQAPAVVGGNVEISQKLVCALLRALGVAASSQGTMNNLVFGNERFSYYETICGGCGAGPDFDGPSAVHSHMTNTRITDVEIIERRYPVRVRRFAVRRGSGGAGRHRGGDGVVRELEFLEPVELSLLTQNRAAGPPGLDGGAPGAPGAQRLVRGDRVLELGSVEAVSVEAGDVLVIETPGGGGCGTP